MLPHVAALCVIQEVRQVYVGVNVGVSVGVGVAREPPND